MPERCSQAPEAAVAARSWVAAPEGLTVQDPRHDDERDAERAGHDFVIGGPVARSQGAVPPSLPTAPPAAALRRHLGPGHPLEPAVRERAEPFFGHDFSQVRVHAGPEAATLTRSMGAQAMAVGPDMVFGAGRYGPATRDGQELIAHELAHVVHQARTGVATVQRRLEIADHTDPLSCDPDRTVADEIQDQLTDVSPRFHVVGNVIEPIDPSTCTSPTETRDQCLCALTGASDVWTVSIGDRELAHTSRDSRTVVVNSRCSILEMGVWGGGSHEGERVWQSRPRVLAHELCGHAWLYQSGSNPPGPHPEGEFLVEPTQGPHAGTHVRTRYNEDTEELEETEGSESYDTDDVELIARPGHTPTVQMENRVGREMEGSSFQPRGEFGSPHHGESFARVTVHPFPINVARVSRLPRDMRDRLGEVARIMRDDEWMMADVLGYADHTGDDATNELVSRQRAEHVRERIVSRGVDWNRFLTVEGRSDTECAGPPPEDNPLCRKAEVYLFHWRASSVGFNPPAGSGGGSAGGGAGPGGNGP